MPSRSINFPLWLVLLSQAEQLGIEKYDGLVITGGCALNVKANDEARLFLSKWQRPVHVPSSPDDGGIAVGAAWLVSPPSDTVTPNNLAYAGLPAFDAHRLNEYITWSRGSLQSNAQLAQLLFDGSIIGVVRYQWATCPTVNHRSRATKPLSLR